MLQIYIFVLLISIIGFFYPYFLIFTAIISIVALGWQFLNSKKSSFAPKSSEFKELKKLKRKVIKKEDKKHRFINDQIEYIRDIWGFTKTQNNTIDKFLKERAYGKIYSKLTASLLPQMILLIESCIQKEKKGCKREVNRRLNELVGIMKEELKNRKRETQESFETMAEVYDYLTLN